MQIYARGSRLEPIRDTFLEAGLGASSRHHARRSSSARARQAGGAPERAGRGSRTPQAFRDFNSNTGRFCEARIQRLQHRSGRRGDHSVQGVLASTLSAANLESAAGRGKGGSPDMVDMQRDEREINLSIPASVQQSAVTGRSAMSSGPAVQLLPGVYNPLSHHQPAAMQHQHYHHHHQHAPAPQHQQAAQPSHHYQWQGQRTPVATAATPPAGARYAFVAPPPAHTTSPSGSAIDHDAGAGNSGMYVLPEQGGWVEQYPEGWYTTASGGAEWAAAAAAAGWGTARLPYGGAWGYAPAPAPPAHHHHHPAAAAAAAYYAVPPHLLHHAAAAAPLLPRSGAPMRGGMAARGSLSGGGSNSGAAAAVYSPAPAYARTAGLAAAAAAATAMPANTYSSHVDPTNMRYTKLSIYAAFSDGGLLQDAADRLANGSLSPADFPQMRVVQHRGVYFSLDNRRLWAFKTAKITSVPVLVMPLFRKLRLRLETQQYKDSVELRWPNSLVAAGAAGPLETAPNTPLSHGKGLLQAEGMPAGSGPLTTDSDATTVVTNAVTTSAEDRRRHLLSDSATVVEHMSPPVSPSPREASGGAAAAALAAAVAAAAVSAGAAALDGGSSVGSGGAGAGGAGGALSSDDEEDGMRTPPSSPDDGEELVGEMRGLTLQGVSDTLTRTPHKYGTGIGKHDVVPLPPRPTFGAAPVSSIAKSRDNSPTAAANAAKAPAFVGGSGGAASGGDASR